MKNSTIGSTRFKSSVRRSVSILLIFAALAVANVANAADLRNTPASDRTNVGLNNLPHQWVMFCYTPYGAYVMAYPLPVGSSCSVFDPNLGVLYGTVGF